MAVVVSAAVVVEAVLEEQPARSAAVKVAAMIALIDFFHNFCSPLLLLIKMFCSCGRSCCGDRRFCRVVVGGVERRFLGIGMLYGAEYLFL